MKVETIVFNKLPEHDTCWAFIGGVDGKMYTGVCGEMTGGLSAYVTSYDPENNQVDYLVEMADAVGVPAGNGQGTHSKVHKCLLQDNDGTLYAATHCTGAPLNDWIWRPWNCWTHPQKQFGGSGFAAFRSDGEILYTKILFPHEGSRCMALAPNRRKIYGLSYPRNHFFIFDLKTREVRDLGRIGNINPQCVFVDGEENAYTTDDYGKLIKCLGDRETLVETGVQIPYASFRNGYHNTLYDVVPDPEDADVVWGVTWTWGQRLFRYDCKRNHLQDFGKAYGEEEKEWFHIIHSHVGGMVFGPDGNLYFIVNRPDERGGSRPHMVRFRPADGKRELLGVLEADGRPADHIARAAMDGRGDLYFSEAGNTPTKLFKCRIDDAEPRLTNIKTRRLWG